MPDDVLERVVSVDPVALAKYAHVCGFTLRDELPATYPHVLAFPLHMDLLGKAPFSAVGVVHIANRIVQHRPLLLGEELTITARVSELRPHRRGREFDFVTEARVGDELVWEDVSTNLKRGDGDESLPREPCVRGPAGHRPLAPARRPRPPLRRRLRRPQPDPPARPDREGVRLPARDRARHVDEGALPGRAAAARRVRGRRALQEADPAALEGDVRRSGRPLRRPLAPGGTLSPR